MNKSLILSILACLWLLFSSWTALCEVPVSNPQDEIQVLIDVSGSMKQNDPNNLRIAANKLLVNLLPEHAKVSIWLFAEKTRALAHSDAVDAAWKKQALQSSDNIHSRGLYTHIEDAIQTVLKNGFNDKGSKHLIILTDGMVDISKHIMVSADSRERILSEWIPKLQQQDIKVLSIALSDQADKELLNKLAFDTGGWAETVGSAEELQRVFLRMLLKAAPKDSLPLTGNKFAVDNSVKEFSLVAFKKPNSGPSQLITPEQKKLDKQSTSNNVSWLENANFDLITVKQPGVGDWRLQADIDPDNQLMILTDLKMQIEELPSFLAEHEVVPIKVHFTDQNRLITHDDLLKVMSVSVILDQQNPVLLEPVIGEPGFFANSFTNLSVGKHQFKLLADGKTFQREAEREVEVVSSAIAVEQVVDQEKHQVSLQLKPDEKLIDIKSLVISTVISQIGKPPVTQTLAAKDGNWTLTVEDLPAGTTTTVNFNVMAKSLDGKPVLPTIKPIKLDDSVFHKVPVVDHPAPEPLVEAEHKPEATSAENHPPEATPNPEQKTNWALVSGIVVGANILLITAGFFIYRAIKKANADKQQQLLEKLS